MFNVLLDEEGVAILAEYNEHNKGLEKSFRDAFDKAHAKIEAKVNEATKLLSEAEKLSNESGIPFRPKHDISGFSVSYVPKSFVAKFGNTDMIAELAADLTGAYGSGDYDGWQSSQVC
jgi:hypothetical protein